MASSTLKKNIKNLLKILVETIACQEKTMRKSAPPKNRSTWGESKKNTAKSTPWYSTTFFCGWRPQMVVSFTTYGARFLPALFASFLAKPLKYTRTQMLSECPLSHPFSSEFTVVLDSFHFPCDCLLNFMQTCPTRQIFNKTVNSYMQFFQNNSVFASKEKNKEQIITCGIGKQLCVELQLSQLSL